MLEKKKKKKYVKNSFISTFTLTFTTAIIILKIVDDGNILMNGRNRRDDIRREQIYYWKIKLWEEEKPISRHIVTNERLLVEEKKIQYARNSRIFLGSGFPIGAWFSAATSLLGPALFKKNILKKWEEKITTE